ncbi:hypothetical protein PIB30_088897 [Stylosanthes scabra]|uniref:Uncharacterized protein n=1 Tax=Stylosanthes scabra TaxID=79078 RepID=A0ABU6WWM9_9FABA|nr:hypothetical protein [Stylosanthes scabra]
MRKGVLEVDSVNALMTQLSTINKKLEKLKALAVGTQVVCGICGGPHENHNCISVQDNQFSAAQIAKQLTEKSPNTLPSDTITNPRQECKAITLRSGKTIKNDSQDQESAEDSRPPPS